MEATEMHNVVKNKTIDLIVGDLAKSYKSELIDVIKETISISLDIYRRTYDYELEQDLKQYG